MKPFYFCTLFGFIIVSCSTGSSAGAGKEGDPLIKTTTYSTGETISYEYDSDGFVTKSVNNKRGRYEYEYSKDEVIENFYDSTGTLKATKKYILNRDGLAAREQNILPENNTEKVYLYNSTANLTTATTIDGENREALVYLYTGEQLDSMERRNNENKLLEKQLMEYYPDLANTAYLYKEGLPFKGRQSPAAVKKLTWNFYDANGNMESGHVLNYTYEQDGQKRIIRAIVKNDSSIIADIRYTYY